MSATPSLARITTTAERVFAAEASPSQREALALVVDTAAPTHPRLPDGEWIYVETSGRELVLHAGSFQALAAAHPTLDVDEAVEAHLATALEDLAAAEETAAAAGDEAELFARHARFRRGDELPYAWYRAGEALDVRTWAVDLDLFAEVWLSRHTWRRLAQDKLRLQIGEDVLDIELPDDVDPAELFTLEGAGLFEDEPELDAPGPASGDLHVLFYVI